MSMDRKKYDFCLGDTSKEFINCAIKEKYDVVTQIINSGLTDDENDSKFLLNMYLDADEKERAIMDAMLVCICGYTMESIIFSCKQHNVILYED